MNIEIRVRQYGVVGRNGSATLVAIFAVLLSSWCSTALGEKKAEGPFDDVVDRVTADLEKRKASAFSASCMQQEHQGGRAVLLVEADSGRVTLFEFQDDWARNAAEVAITSKGLSLVETNGGLYSYRRVSLLIDSLARQSFRLLSPFKRTKWLALPTSGNCPLPP